jgi:hypothetical protein
MARRPQQPEPASWSRVHLMHGRRAEHRGIVRARDEAEAIDRAMEEFELKAWQRRRVLVWRDE